MKILTMLTLYGVFRNPEETSDSMVDIDENNTYERDQYLAAWDLYNSYLANAIADLKLPFYLVKLW